MELVVRSELDGVMNYKGQDQLLSIKALNEFDPKHTGEPRLPMRLQKLFSWVCEIWWPRTPSLSEVELVTETFSCPAVPWYLQPRSSCCNRPRDAALQTADSLTMLPEHV